MKQPDLGKRIAEARKAGGWTQEQLAGRCNINVRTLQRIESGSVAPRSYTIRILSDVLGELNGALEETPKKPLAGGFRDLFNFKTHTMTKVSVWGAIALTAGFLTVSGLQKSHAQKSVDPDKYRIITNFSMVTLAFPAKSYKSVEQYLENDGRTAVMLYRGDTIRTRMGEGVYSLNDRQVVRGRAGDVVVYRPKTWFRESRLEYRPLQVKYYPSALESGIIYKVPADATFRATGPVSDEPDTQEYVINGFMPVEEKRVGDRIYVDDREYQPGDTVDLTPQGLIRFGSVGE